MSLCLTQAEFDHIRQAYDPVASRSGSIHSDCYLDSRYLKVEQEQVFHFAAADRLFLPCALPCPLPPGS